jgi:hypothetical protein
MWHTKGALGLRGGVPLVPPRAQVAGARGFRGLFWRIDAGQRCFYGLLVLT